jgi:DNA-directed RNA polymerase I, II, and III subunit RPABC2
MADEIEKILGGAESDIDDDSSIGSSEGSNVDREEYEGGGKTDDEEEDEEEDDDNSEIDETEKGEIEQEESDPIIEEYENSELDSDEEELDDDYLQKMDDHVRKRVIEDHHPELKTLNYEEVEALATVVRDKNNLIIDPLHRTLPILTRYEKARILGERARQINAGAKPMIEVDVTMIDGYLIALKELEQKRIPFIIQRPMPNGGSEYWRLADLE